MVKRRGLKHRRAPEGAHRARENSDEQLASPIPTTFSSSFNGAHWAPLGFPTLLQDMRIGRLVSSPDEMATRAAYVAGTSRTMVPAVRQDWTQLESIERDVESSDLNPLASLDASKHPGWGEHRGFRTVVEKEQSDATDVYTAQSAPNRP